ncbi:MAG: Coenzyme F420 hydrogenase/dehydrogenase, beta subunit C-terminal domain, partial [Alistipes sp.]|nr:Coenzyme F420 hydrogenase/dehydrogenase, beta subunit C-terminal domain [Alistipes sp.]
FRNARAWGYAPRASVRDSWLPLCGIHDIYMKAFDKALIFRESCYDCRFNGLSRVGDLTVADFWGVGRCGVPFRHDVTKGVSLVLPNSPKGVDLLSELKDVFMEQRPVGEAVPYNNNLVNSSPRNPLRESVIADFLDPDIPLSRIDNKYCLVGRSASARVKGLLIRMGLFYPLKSLYNKITLLR